MRQDLGLKGVFSFELVRNGLVIAKFGVKNATVDEGIANLFDVTFGGTTASDPWYIGLINNTPTPTLLTTDVLGTSNWTEFTNYTDDRKEWVDAATSSRVKGTTSAAAFSILGTATLYGMFLTNVDTGTSGTLFSEGAFSSTIPVVSADTVNASYSIQA